jgi:hypothetical protein
MGIFRKKASVNLSDPDFENSQAVIDETAKIFSKMMRRVSHDWTLQGNNAVDYWLRKHKKWLPDEEFKIAAQMKNDIWMIFSSSLINQASPGRYSQVNIGSVSVGFPSSKNQQEQFAESLTHGMYLVLNSDREYLAQTFLFRLCAVWVHSRLANIQE